MGVCRVEFFITLNQTAIKGPEVKAMTCREAVEEKVIQDRQGEREECENAHPTKRKKDSFAKMLC